MTKKAKLAPLTPEQNRVLNYIIEYKEKHGFVPSVREAAQELGYKSANNVRQHLRLIERKGHIRIAQGLARGIEILSDKGQESIHNDTSAVTGNFPDQQVNAIPLVGLVAAGAPITAVENIEGYLTLDRTMFRGEDLFALRVRGESMKGIGIFDSDIAVVRKKNTADNGEVVVAVVNDEATLKRFVKKSDHIVLRAENPAFKDIIVGEGEDIMIAGKLVGVIRKF
ncbi:MAG: transcriptional repressor LexA [Chitinispirillia bacterium]|nr:transcriptional repressor LexA [Chitinispirillia bacterium]